MPTKTHDRTNPLLIIIIILIHANLQGPLASPATHREEVEVHTSLAKAVRQDNVHSLRYYPPTLRTSTIASNHVLQREFIAAPGGAAGRFNNVKQQQAVPAGGVPVVRNARHAKIGLTQSEEDIDYDYGQEMPNMDDAISAASFPSLTSRKRGFSVLARWKPFTNISKLRMSSRQHQQQLLRPIIAQQKAQAQAQQMLSSAANDYDVISAETRALLLRPSGQPLRWG